MRLPWNPHGIWVSLIFLSKKNLLTQKHPQSFSPQGLRQFHQQIKWTPWSLPAYGSRWRHPSWISNRSMRHMVMDFLRHIESALGNNASTRNVRLAAIKSFMRFVEHRVPSVREQSLRVLAIPSKKPMYRWLTICRLPKCRRYSMSQISELRQAFAIELCCIYISWLGFG